MRLATFEVDGRRALGAVEGDAIRDLTGVAGGAGSDMVELITTTDLAELAGAAGSCPSLPLSTVRLLAPIPRPRKNVMAVGRNYRDHAAEFSRSGFDASERQMIPDQPVIFTKAPTSVIGPGDPIDTANDPTRTTDYEAELGVVIGREGRGIASERALEHVFGYTIVNDVTARDLQKRHVQWFIGKSPDSFCPMGPWITTADAVSDIRAAMVRTWVDGELRQRAPVSDLIFDIPTLIATLSAVMTLEAGDVIATGTPLGVGIGFDPPRYLQPGQLVEIEIDAIGRLVNPVV